MLKRNMLRIGGGLHKKVFSLYAEKVIMQHPKVRSCVVVPKDDPVEHQVPVAFILPEGDAEPAEALMREIIEYCNAELDTYHRPVKCCWLEKIPLTKVGKVDYRTLEKGAENI